MNSPLEPPRESPADYVHALVKGTLGSVPIGGSLAAEAFNAIFGPPYQKRQRAWQENVFGALVDLQQRTGSIDLTRLQQDDEFLSMLASASQLAFKTHRKEKLEALRNGC